MGNSNKWVIFDGDNTLWDIEFLYDEARDSLCKYLQSYGVDFDAAHSYQHERDVVLFHKYGYSPVRFPQSFIDTVTHFLGEDNPAEIEHATSLARTVFTKKPKFSSYLSTIFEELRPEYSLGLLTAGEIKIQEKRIKEFPHADSFRCIDIVEKKSALEIGRFVKENLVDLSCSWYVGDSYNSDVLPAKEVGLNVIWYKNHNWQKNENSRHDNNSPANRGIFEANTLQGVLETISVNSSKY